MVGKMAWFRPADTVLRVPFTPDSELAKEARAVVDEEATRLGLKVKVVEGSGVPLKRQITTSDLGAGKPCPQGNCLLCITGDGKGGLSHHRSGGVYSGVWRVQTLSSKGGGQHGCKVLGRVRRFLLLPHSGARRRSGTQERR